MTPRTWQIDLPYTRPPKGLSANDRPGHWSIKNRSTQDVRIAVKLAAAVLRIPKMQHMGVELVWHVADKRKRDPDNIYPLLKAVCDALGSDRGTSAQLVPDDSPEWMTKHAPRIVYTAGGVPAYFRVHVTELEAAP